MTQASTAPSPQAPDDLLALVAAGDQDAFGAFYDQVTATVVGVIQHVVIDPSQTEEVVREVFLEAWQNAARFDPSEGSALSWILAMAHRRAVASE